MKRNLVLGVFAKWPEPGQVKTRLAEVLGPDKAAKAAQAFLLDTLERVTHLKNVATRHVIAYAPDEAQAHFTALVKGSFELRPQGDGDLGRRLSEFLHAEVADGADGIVVLGTDSPNLPIEYIDKAFTELHRADLVLGPATDGGLYLLACGKPVPPVFEGVSWGKSRVLDEVVARLPMGGWRLKLLPPWYDIDTPEDWNMLRGHVTAMRRAGIDPRIAHTEEVLLEIGP